jgi:hypothetical protein
MCFTCSMAKMTTLCGRSGKESLPNPSAGRGFRWLGFYCSLLYMQLIVFVKFPLSFSYYFVFIRGQNKKLHEQLISVNRCKSV